MGACMGACVGACVGACAGACMGACVRRYIQLFGRNLFVEIKLGRWSVR